MTEHITVSRELLRLALDALEWREPSGLTGPYGIASRKAAITALRTALEQPVKAIPVEYQYHYPDGQWRCSRGESINGVRPDASRPLYAKPYSMPLTDAEISEIANRLEHQGNTLLQFARAIEQAHGIGSEQ